MRSNQQRTISGRLPRICRHGLGWAVVMMAFLGIDNRSIAQDDFRSLPVTVADNARQPIAANPLAALAQRDASGLLSQNSDLPVIDGQTEYAPRQLRSPEGFSVRWQSPGFRYRRLFFEDAAIERGNQQRQFSYLSSGIRFSNSLLRLPLRIVTGR